MNWSMMHLRAVDEVSELGFPHHECVWLGQRIAVFKAEGCFFREERVDDFVFALVVAEWLSGV